MKDIGIVICNYNKEDYILNCIKSVLNSSINNYDIFVVDNASTDNSVIKIKEEFGCSVTLLINSQNKGGSGGFNTGLREVLKHEYKYIMLLDNDIILDVRAIEELYLFMEKNDNVGMVGSKVYYMDNPERIWGYGGNINFRTYKQEDNFKNCTDSSLIPQELYCDYVAACSLMARSEAIKSVGLMPESNFIYWDDMEWGYRFNLSGFKVAVCGKSKIWHKAGGRNAGDTFINYYMWRNRIRFFMKVIPKEEIKHFSECILTELFRMIYSCKLKGEENIIKSVMYALDDAIYNYAGKAEDYKILKRNTVQNRLELAVKDANRIMIIFNDDFEGLGNIVANLMKISSDIQLVICTKYSKYSTKEVKGQFSRHDITDEDNYILADVTFMMCNHIFDLVDYNTNYCYIDSWCNVLFSRDDFDYSNNYQRNLDLFLLCKKDLIINSFMNKPIIIFGASIGGIKVAKILKGLNIDFKFFADNDNKKWGTIVEDKLVINPDELIEGNYRILIASDYQEEIEIQLQSMGLLEKIILKEELIMNYALKNISEFKLLKEPNSKTYNILFDLLESTAYGGIEIWSYLVAGGLMKNDYNVHILGNIIDIQPPDDLLHLVSELNINYADYWNSIKVVVESIVNKLPCTIIINRQGITLIAAAIVKHLFPDKIRCISIIHTDKIVNYRRQAFMQTYVDKIAGVSRMINNHMLEEFNINPKKVKFKESPVKSIADFNKTYTLDNNSPIQIGYAARITKTQKRVDLLLKLIEDLESKNLNYILNIAGDGPYLEKLNEFVNKNKLLNKVIVLGKISREEMNIFWKEQDIFINVSDYEGTSLSMLEAMSYGVIPIVTDVSGVRDIIEDKQNGFITELRDINTISDILCFLESNRSNLNLIGKNAKKTVEEKCNKEDYIKYIISLIELEED